MPQRDQQGEGDDEEEAAQQPPFLGHGREDEVGVRLGEERDVALGAVKEAVTEQARPSRSRSSTG